MRTEIDRWRAAPALPADPRPGTRPLATTALGTLGIELVECGAERLVARMPVDGTMDARGTLLVLAESAASTAAGIVVGPTRRAFGAELNGATLATPARGMVVAVAEPLSIGAERHVWQITAFDGDDAQVLQARCTLGVVDAV